MIVQRYVLSRWRSPGEQGTLFELPATGQYVPALQGVQAEADVPAEYVPVGHDVQ